MKAVEHNQQFLQFCVSGFVVLLAMKLLACEHIDDITTETDVPQLASDIVDFVKPDINRESIDAVSKDSRDDPGNDDNDDDDENVEYCTCQIPEIEGMYIMM